MSKNGRGRGDGECGDSATSRHIFELKMEEHPKADNCTVQHLATFVAQQMLNNVAETC